MAETAALPAEKARLRAAALAARDALDPAYRAEASAAAAAGDLPFAAAVAGRLVAGFWPMRSEIDPRPLMARLDGVAAGLALPFIAEGRLRFRRWRFGEALARGGFGTSEPEAGAGEVEPDALIVPLAAFDRAGGRIGYGRAYYDGYIAAMRARGPSVAIGIAFACQEVAAVPMEPHDQRLDWILTENGALAVGAEAAAERAAAALAEAGRESARREREERLAAALRANLKRRKAAARGGRESADDGGMAAPPTEPEE